jgi:hypothetical protein
VTRIGIFLLAGLLVFVPCVSWADRDRPTFRLSHGARANWRESTDLTSEAVGRMEVEVIRRSWWRLLPFFEARRAVARNTWSRLEVGAELAMKPFLEFSPPFSWMTVAHGLHQTWLAPGNDHPEWEIRTLFDIPLPFFKVRSTPVGIYLLNEYSYDLEHGAGIRNEAGAGVLMPLPVRHFSFLLGWRHVDRVHFTDMDQFEGSLIAEF